MRARRIPGSAPAAPKVEQGVAQADVAAYGQRCYEAGVRDTARDLFANLEAIVEEEAAAHVEEAEKLRAALATLARHATELIVVKTTQAQHASQTKETP